MPRSSTPVRPTHRKVHVSLPADVFEAVERRSKVTGAPFSTTLAGLVRQEMEAEEQARLEQALALDREANAAFAASVAPLASRIVGAGDAALAED